LTRGTETELSASKTQEITVIHNNMHPLQNSRKMLSN